MKNKIFLPCAALAALLAGCMSLPSVGPDYKEPEFEISSAVLPDAGWPRQI